MPKKKDSVIGNMRIDKSVMIGMNLKEELNKLFYAKEDYDAELEMLKFQYDNEEEERVGLHASAISSWGSGSCYRQQVLSLFYKQKQGENTYINLKRIFEEGKSIGTKWQRLFIRGKVGIKEDMDVSRMVEEYDLSYTPDAKIKINGKTYVVEIKSMNTKLFQEGKSHSSGKKQLKLYMYFEKQPLGFILIEDKNTQDFRCEVVTNVTGADPDISDIVERLEKIQEYKRTFLKKKKMVARHEKCVSASCPKARNCPMQDACWNVGKGRVKINSK